jgi:predicted ATP-dependent serine protease
LTQRRCQECGHFYDKKRGVCDKCGVEAYPFNKGLHTANLNAGLYKQAELAQAQKRR